MHGTEITSTLTHPHRTFYAHPHLSPQKCVSIPIPPPLVQQLTERGFRCNEQYITNLEYYQSTANNTICVSKSEQNILLHFENHFCFRRYIAKMK